MATQTRYHTSWQVVLGSPWRDNWMGWGWTLEAVLCPERKAVLQSQVLRGSTSCFVFFFRKKQVAWILDKRVQYFKQCLNSREKGKEGKRVGREGKRGVGERGRKRIQAYQTKWNMARACHRLFKGSREKCHSVFLSLLCLLSPNSPSFLSFQKEMTTRMCH